MVFTVRCILGCFLVVLSCTIIQPASLAGRDESLVKVAKTEEIPVTTATIRGTVRYTTILPEVDENDIKRETTTSGVELNVIKNSTSEENVIKNITTSAEENLIKNDIRNITASADENLIKNDDKNITTSSDENVIRKEYNATRTDNSRSLDFDISKYTSPEFQSRNAVYNLPTSPENDKYIDPEIIAKSYKPSSEFSFDFTTPKSESFDKRYHEVEEEIIRKIESPTLDELIERSKDNTTDTDLNVIRYVTNSSEDRSGANFKHKSSESEKVLKVNFESKYNETKNLDNKISPEGTDLPKKISKDSLVSNKIKTEILKAVDVNSRGSTRYADSLKTTTEIPRNKNYEQSVQENNIHPVIVPVPIATTESTTTVNLFEMTAEESVETSTEYFTSVYTTSQDNQEYFEMTSESTTTVLPESTLTTTFETTTLESLTKIEESTTKIMETTYLPSTMQSDGTTMLPTTAEETSTQFTEAADETTTEIVKETTNPETTTVDFSTTENAVIKDESKITTSERSRSTKNMKIFNIPTTQEVTEESTTEAESEDPTELTNLTITEATTATEVRNTTSNDDMMVSDQSTIQPEIEDVVTKLPQTAEISTLTNLIITTAKVRSSTLKDDVTTETSTIAVTTQNAIMKEYDGKIATESAPKIDVKENDIVKENVTKINQNETSDIEDDADDIVDEMDYMDVHSKKSNKTNEEIEIVPMKPERTTQNVRKLTPEVRKITTTTVSYQLDVEENEAESDTEESRMPEEENSGTVIAIIISSVGAVCLIILAVLLFVMRRRQKRFNYGQRCTPVSLDSYSMDNVSVYNSVRRKAIRGSKRSYGNPAFDDATVSHPLNFQGISKFATNTEDISDEFEEIPQVTARMTELPEGCDTKNRYANVIPLPETRVFLSPVDDDPTGDYINANYVTGPKGVRGYYIACQAPMQSTVNDFWRMIWEQQSKVVLMLTHMYENGVEKCVDYLPPSEVLDCHRLFGDYQVTLKKREVKDKYIISSLQLKNMVSNSWREITHIWYSGWPEKGVPEEENSLIAFLIEARSYVKLIQNSADIMPRETNGNINPEVCPVVVHCSPGTARTGTVIACDIAIREFEMKRVVDIPKIVYKIRRGRASSVQTKDQYAFIYRVINTYATKLTGGALDTI